MKKFLLFILSIIAACLGLNFHSSSEERTLPTRLCLSQFYQQIPPILQREKLKQSIYPLCFEGFTLQYSAISKTPLWVAESLSPERLQHKLPRINNFHEETRLPKSAQATLMDYRASGYDRGHMAPNGDMYSEQSQFDSFSLANMIPQTPENNQNTWREIEESVRAMVTKYHSEIYVVTGPLYLEPSVKYIKKGHAVLVPSHIYKAIYIPKLGIASAYFSPNDQSKSAKIISICALEQLSGINIFPHLDEYHKRQVFDLAMQANKVKAKRHPIALKTDQHSRCATMPTAQQIQQTQQSFIQDLDYTQQPKTNSPIADITLDTDISTWLNRIKHAIL